MRKWLRWFDPSDSLETTLTFLLLLPFVFLITPPMMAAQLPDGFFLPVTLLGWLALPTLTWQLGQWARRRSGRPNRRGFASLLIWLGVCLGFTPLLLLVAGLFWKEHDYPWTAGLFGVGLVLVWESANRLRDYSRPARGCGHV